MAVKLQTQPRQLANELDGSNGSSFRQLSLIELIANVVLIKEGN